MLSLLIAVTFTFTVRETALLQACIIKSKHSPVFFCLKYYSIKAIMLMIWRIQTCTSSHEEDNIAWHLIYHCWSRRLRPHALFVLSKFLYIFRVKVTHCQLAVCPAHLWLYICHTLNLDLWLISQASFVQRSESGRGGREKRKRKTAPIGAPWSLFQK